MALFKPRVRPSLTSPQTLTITAPGIQSLTDGVDYRIVLPATPVNGRIWLSGGRKVHVGWGATPSAHGGEIRESTGSTCLIVENMEECWIEGIAAYAWMPGDVPSTGACFQIRCTTTTFPVHLLNCYGIGSARGIVEVRNGICPKVTIDGMTFVSHDNGITATPAFGGVMTELDCTRLSAHRAAGTSPVIEIPATATFFDSWLVDDTAPTAALAGMVTGEDTTDVQGNLIFAAGGTKNGVIFKGTPPGGDWVPEAETGLSYVAPGYEIGQTSAEAGALRLATHPEFAIPLTSPTTTNVGAAGATLITLSAGQHRHITLNSGTAAVTDYVHIDGVVDTDNRIWIRGGQITNDNEFDSGSANSSRSHCLKIRFVDFVYIEGVKFDKLDTCGDGLALERVKLCIIQNCRGVGFNFKDIALGHAITQHGDWIQIQSQCGQIWIDQATFQTWNHGLLINSSLDDQFELGPALVRGGVLRRVNGSARDPALNPVQPSPARRPLYTLQDDCSMKPVPWVLLETYGRDEKSPPDTIAQLVRPSAAFNAGDAACGANYDSVNLRATWPVATQIQGYIQYGQANGADYVPSTFTGLSYQTPGYDGVPRGSVQRGAFAATFDHTPSAYELVQAAYTFRGQAAPGTSGLFPRGGAEPGTQGVAVDGVFYDHADQKIAPHQEEPAWLSLTARSFTYTGGTVGQELTVDFAVFAQNALYDPRTRSIVVSATSSAVGCTLALGTASIGITPTQQSPVSFGFTIQDSAGNTSSATFTLTGVQPGVVVPPPSGFIAKWYGNPFCHPFTSLGNTTVPGSRLVAHPFLAYYTGDIVSIKCYYLWSAAGYSSGTGGTYRVRLVKTRASDGRPDMTQILGTSNAFNSSSGTFPNVSFPSPIPVVAGTRYAIIHYNVDSNPSANFASVDDQNTNWMKSSDGSYAPTPITPFIADLDHRTVYSDNGGSSWTIRPRTPILQLNYQDGKTQGCGYENAGGAHSNDYSGPITASDWAREVWTQGRTITATHVGVCVGIDPAGGNDPLTIRLLQGANLLQTATIAAADAKNPDLYPFGNSYLQNRHRRWHIKALSPNLVFTQGLSYTLELRATNATRWWINESHRGSGWKVGGDVTWGGVAQYSNNSGGSWSNWIHQGNASSVCDLAAAFRTT